jgi:hypothetical protein
MISSKRDENKMVGKKQWEEKGLLSFKEEKLCKGKTIVIHQRIHL